jgi:tetratricopeptide (TPR) repeat protein
MGLLLIGAAVLATFGGADQARRRFDPREVATTAISQALELGSADTQVRDKVVELRRVMGRRPLDTRTRSIYASLLLSLTSRVADLPASVFHARLAARMSPVTVPVVQLATLVLAHAGEPDEAVALVHDMFGYDPESAAELLFKVRHLLSPAQIAQAIAETPESWLAWSKVLETQGENDASTASLENAHERFPMDLAILERLATKSADRKDWIALRSLFPEEEELPEESDAARLFAYRAMVKGLEQDRAGARQDIETALKLDPESVALQVRLGDAYDILEEHDEARKSWQGALFRLPPGQPLRRQGILLRLARLEHEHGQPAAALRHWRAILAIDSEHAEARRRVQELTGVDY